MNKQEWAELAKVLGTFYPHNFRPTDATEVKLWYMALADLPGDRVGAAIWSMVRMQAAFPSVADIRRLAEGAADTAAEAWAEALRIVREKGTAPEHRRFQPKGVITYQEGRVVRQDAERGELEQLVIPDPILEKTIHAIGGLQALGQCEVSRLDTMRAQFLKLYAAFTAESKRAATFASLGVSPELKALPAGEPAALGAVMAQVIKQAKPPTNGGLPGVAAGH